jgi:PPOX class probable F420-dependent enzyme
MDVPAGARRHLDEDHVVWLTTITDSGAPAPWPVWFVADGDDIVVFSEPTTRRVHNIEQRPRVALHFNCGAEGDDAWIISGTAALRPRVKPSGAPGYEAKYRAAIEGALQTTVEQIDATYDTEIRITPTAIRTV